MSDTRPPASRWTPQAVIGLLCVVAGEILPRLAPDLLDASSALTALGASLLGWSRSLPAIIPADRRPPPPPPAPEDGSVPPAPRDPDTQQTNSPRTALAVGGLFALVALAACATTHDARESVRVDVRRGPPCVVRVEADGRTVATVRGDMMCEVAQ